ncbi:MAG: DUF4118 domain-containing protein [Gemmataceae bacterium]
MSELRPDPDRLLARVREEEASSRRGRLKIFFGYAAGVGKTFAMLEAAQQERADGADVVVGYVETHGRPETDALLAGLEAVAPRWISYRGVSLRELDMDAVLKRKPELVLVDELAHTNAEGLRHAKRWQDVQEILDAGIDVFTTLNVQHLESLNDIVAQITGVIVRETVPDSVLERANDIELVDLTPEQLIERLHQGKVYIPQQAERALQNFFQKSNLMALRELSLRQAAHRLHRDVEAARLEKEVPEPWATSERLLVCIGPSPTSARLIRTARRMAAAFHCDWLAVAVDTSGHGNSDAVRQQIAQHLRLAEGLGAETHTLVGNRVGDTLIEFARARNVTKIVVGKTAQPWWRRLMSHTVVDDLLNRSGDIDVYVIRGEGETLPPRQRPSPVETWSWTGYLGTAAIVGVCALLGWGSHALQLSEANIVMVFLLGVALSATYFGRGPSIFAAVASVLIFDFFFVSPYLTLTVDDTQYVITFIVLLVIGLWSSTLTARVRAQLEASQQQERRTAALYRLTKVLSEVAGTEFLVQSAGNQLREIFDGQVLIFLRDPSGPVQLRFGQDTVVAKESVNSVVAQWVAEHDQAAGASTDTLPSATALFVPLVGSQGTVGALGIAPADPHRLVDPDQRRLLQTCASVIALSIERDRSLLDAHHAQMQVEAEQMRSSLLSSVSHDLRTPLAAIAGASSSLLEGQSSSDTQHELLQSIIDEARRLSRLVDNLLDMTRLDTGGALALDRQWHVLEEILGLARTRLRRELAQHQILIDVPLELPLLSVDGSLMEQLFVNLLENASRYTPPASLIEIKAQRVGKLIEIRVCDNGPGLPVGSEEKVFDKFYRGGTNTVDGRRGVGLGLAICRAIVQAHGGRIRARNRPQGGCEFIIELPCAEEAPKVPLDEVPVVNGQP